MRVYKRDGSPFFYYDLTTPKGRRRVSTKVKTRREALHVAGRALHQAETQAGQAPLPEGVTVAAAMTAYVNNCRALGRTVWSDYERIQAKTLGLAQGRYGLPVGLLVSEVSGRLLGELKAARAAEGNAPGTIGLELKLLRAVCRYAADQLGSQPPAVTKWDIPAGSEKLRYLSRDEADKLLAHLQPTRPVPSGRSRVLVVPQGRVLQQRQDAYDLTVLLLFTGARWHEIAALTWGQVSGSIRLWSEKTNKERSVPLLARVREILERRRIGSNHALVFPGSTNGEGRAGPSRAITRAMDAVGLNDPAIVRQFGRANIHTLRHTYASWLRQAGLGLDEIQPLLGHATIAQTQVYAKIVEASSLDRAARALDGQ